MTLGKLWCVFGCGGERDATKRPLMAAVAEKNADRVVVTSDNPRGEKPENIISQILLGLSHDKCVQVQADRALDFTSYQQLVVHPHVGQLLLSQLTDYPAALARAIAEHHEHLDGSGYPQALQRDAISPLGRLLAVTEGSLAVLRGERPYLARVSVALRVVPGEYDLSWLGRIAEAARIQPALHATLAETMPYLVHVLGLDEGADFTLEQQEA